LSVPDVEKLIASPVAETLKAQGCAFSAEYSYFLFQATLFSYLLLYFNPRPV